MHFALITFYNASENFIAAFGTNIAGVFILNPFFITDSASGGYEFLLLGQLAYDGLRQV